VEQLHKIFKLCGSPTEEYWKKSKLPHATIFKPQQPYRKRIRETFKDFPQSALQLIETLLAIDPADRLTASSALRSDVSWLPFLIILSPFDGTRHLKFFICVKSSLIFMSTILNI
jgi:serine/threonine protein kinase